MKIYFLPSYMARAPSTRMRVYKIAEFLQKQGQEVEILLHDLSVESKHKRLKTIESDDVLYVQKWRTEFNSAEHISRYKGKCKIVFDLDDLTGDPQAAGLLEISDALVVGNHFLFNKYNDCSRSVFLVPSAVDYTEYTKFIKEGDLSISIAKCGIRPMLSALNKIKDVLHSLHEEFKYKLVLVGFNNATDKVRAEKMFPFARCHMLQTYDNYLQYTVPMLQTTTIGILPFTKRDNGKSGHSALANLAMGIPTCTSPYAECDHIIKSGVNGFLVNRPVDWYNRIKDLFEDAELRQQFRHEGWKTIIDKYDIPVIGRQLLEDLRTL
jgi:glycosyltransferase involved in cell wall biosynthesis